MPTRSVPWDPASRSGASATTRGVDRDRGNFVASLGAKGLDAALLLLPDVGFVSYDDERMLRTVAAIRVELDDGGLILRYRADDGLRGTEGSFLPCSFWLAECLAREGRMREARQVFDLVCRCANDLGLLPQEYASSSEEMLGNYPQGLTHLAHVSAALALRAEVTAQGHRG